MRVLKNHFILFTALFLSNSLCAQSVFTSEAWLTVPEKTNYEATSTYVEVMDMINTLVDSSPLLQLDTLGYSPLGKVIPLVVAVDIEHQKKSLEELRKMPVLYMQGNIHAGEVEGKEALLMILRDIAMGNYSTWLNDRVVLINPIYNTDSNDDMEEGIRPSQEDSPKKVGQRPNSQGLDLNRDGMKAEANETKALLAMLDKWDPDLFVDFHTTNGTWHGYRLTWAPAYHTIGDERLFDYSWLQMLPKITKAVKENYDLDFGPYGWYNLRDGWPPKKIETYNHHPRYVVNQMGLRNRMAILSETFAHDRFYHRIQAAYAFATEILNHFEKDGEIIKQLNKDAEKQTIDSLYNTQLGLRFNKVALPDPFTLRTYDYQAYKDDSNELKYVRSTGIVEYDSVLNYSAFEAEIELTVPKFYYIPQNLESVLDLLNLHHVEHYALAADSIVTVEKLKINSVDQAQRAFQGHKMLQIDDYSWEIVNDFKLATGGIIVPMNQSLSRLAFYVLEGLSDDGVVTWNFLDEQLLKATGSESVTYPILRGF